MRQLSFFQPVLSIKGFQTQSEKTVRDNTINKGLKLLTIIVLLMTGSVIFIARRVPPLVPFHYARPWGEEQLVSRLSLWLVLLATVAAAITNTTWSLLIYERDQLLSKLILWGTILVMSLMTIAFWYVWLQVGH